MVANLLFVIFGVTNPDITGYGTLGDLLVGAGVLLISVLLYVFRRVVQDRQSISLREEAPPIPPAPPAAAAAISGTMPATRTAVQSGDNMAWEHAMI